MRRLTLRYCTAWQQQETKEKSIKAMELKAKELKPKVHMLALGVYGRGWAIPVLKAQGPSCANLRPPEPHTNDTLPILAAVCLA